MITEHFSGPELSAHQKELTVFSPPPHFTDEESKAQSGHLLLLKRQSCVIVKSWNPAAITLELYFHALRPLACDFSFQLSHWENRNAVSTYLRVAVRVRRDPLYEVLSTAPWA